MEHFTLKPDTPSARSLALAGVSISLPSRKYYAWLSFFQVQNSTRPWEALTLRKREDLWSRKLATTDFSTVPSLHKHGQESPRFSLFVPSLSPSLVADTLLGENQQRRKHKGKKDIEKVKLTERSLTPASRKTRQFVLRQINFLKYAGLPVVAGSFIARMFYGHVFFSSPFTVLQHPPPLPADPPAPSFCPNTSWRVIKSGLDICENILSSEQKTYTVPETLANSKNVMYQLTKTNISKCCALGLIGEPSLITPRAAAGFDHDHPASSGNEIFLAAIRRRCVENNAVMVIAK